MIAGDYQSTRRGWQGGRVFVQKRRQRDSELASSSPGSSPQAKLHCLISSICSGNRRYLVGLGLRS